MPYSGGSVMTIITEKTCTEQSTIKSVSHFYKQYQLGIALKKAGAYKQKGIPVLAVIIYLITLVYTGKSMFQDMRSANPLAQGFKKDTIYRFLNRAFINWQAFLLQVGHRVIADIDKLTCAERLSVFIVDETIFPALYAKKTELVSWVYDYAEKGGNKFKRGFRMLVLGWSDGASFIPLAFRHLASSNRKKRLCECRANLDKRSRAYRIRQEAVSKATTVLLKQLKVAMKAGITARHVLFDSWFAYPITITKICKLGLHVTARVKDADTILYLLGNEKKTAKQIFRSNRKRRGRSRYLLSVPVTIISKGDDGTQTQIDARLVYVRNRANRSKWIALLSTDTSLSEEDIIALYGKRWDIEVFFKVCKSYLKLTGEFRQLSYDAITAHTTIVMIRYMILAIEKRKQDDPRSLGELFFLSFDEVADIRFETALFLIMILLADTLNDLGLTEEKIEEITDRFIEDLPYNIRTCLSSCLGVAA